MDKHKAVHRIMYHLLINEALYALTVKLRWWAVNIRLMTLTLAANSSWLPWYYHYTVCPWCIIENGTEVNVFSLKKLSSELAKKLASISCSVSVTIRNFPISRKPVYFSHTFILRKSLNFVTLSYSPVYLLIYQDFVRLPCLSGRYMALNGIKKSRNIATAS